jgi:hypothetical protein
MAKETYHGHELVYTEPGGEGDQAPSLQIDGRDVEVVIHSDQTYSAKEYYYDKFGSVAALARAIARRYPE